ncbi:MAG: tetratricopeptide repeat protein [Ignavibacteria bacterium]|nr:tetratricopeptide repeat protein [Ignavibacteria bacterium]
MIISVLVVIGILIYKEFNRDTVVIEVFQVPLDLERQNITGQAIVSKLMDNIKDIESKADTAFPLLDYNPVMYDSQLEIVIPGSGISLKSLIQNVKNFLGKKQTRITGEVVLADKKIYLTTRILGKPSRTFSGDLTDLDKILYDAARYVLIFTQPYMLAYYYYYSYGSDDMNTDLAMDMIDYSISNPPENDDVMAYTLYGYILSDQGKFDESITMYENALELDPRYTDALTGWAYSLFEMHKYDESEELYKKAIRIDPNDSYSYYYYALLKERMNSLSEADSLYQSALELDVSNFEAMNSYSIFLMNQDRISDAKNILKKIIKIRPDNPEAYINLGKINQLENKPEEALLNFKKSFKLDSANYFPLIYASQILAEQEKTEDAANLIKAIDLNQKLDKSLTKDLGLLLEDLGRKEDFNVLYNNSIKNFPEDSTYFKTRISEYGKKIN